MKKYQVISDDVKVGEGTYLGNFINLYGCEIGDHCVIATGVEIGKGVRVGNNCKIGFGSFLPPGVYIEDDVFIGPRTCFTNDKYPRAYGEWEMSETYVRKKAAIGANCTILPGIEIGEEAMIGSGSVVTKSIPARKVAFGNPARIVDDISNNSKYKVSEVYCPER